MKKLGKGSIIGRYSRSILERAQQKQQTEVTRRLEDIEGISLKASIIREADGSGGDRLSKLLAENPDNPEIVMLIAGATDGMTYTQQAFPKLFSFWAKDDRSSDRAFRNSLEKAITEGKAGAAERLFSETRDDLEEALANPMKGVSTVDYMVNRAKEIRSQILKEKECALIIVRNSNAQDLHDVAEAGGKNRVALIHGHGFRSSVEMTDGRVSNHELKKPENKLKAMVLDTCGGESRQQEESESMGDGISDTVYGFDRVATPRDIFGRRLRQKSPKNDA